MGGRQGQSKLCRSLLKWFSATLALRGPEIRLGVAAEVGVEPWSNSEDFGVVLAVPYNFANDVPHRSHPSHPCQQQLHFRVIIAKGDVTDRSER